MQIICTSFNFFSGKMGQTTKSAARAGFSNLIDPIFEGQWELFIKQHDFLFFLFFFFENNYLEQHSCFSLLNWQTIQRMQGDEILMTVWVHWAFGHHPCSSWKGAALWPQLSMWKQGSVRLVKPLLGADCLIPSPVLGECRWVHQQFVLKKCISILFTPCYLDQSSGFQIYIFLSATEVSAF